jgi:small subunit ribosomal protein S5
MAEQNVSAAPAPAAAPQNQNRPNDRQRGGGQRGGRQGGGPRRDNRDQTPEEKQFDERVIHIDRVARVVKGGRRFRFRALVVVGDRKGKVGIGLAKGADVTAAVAKATEVAKKHLIKIIRYKDTIPHDVDGKVAGARILIMPAAPGTGLIAGGVVRTILEVAGIGNALSKSFGSSNKSNIAYATLQALESIVPAKDWVTTKHKAAVAVAKKAETAKAAKVEPAKKPVAKAKKEEK